MMMEHFQESFSAFSKVLKNSQAIDPSSATFNVGMFLIIPEGNNERLSDSNQDSDPYCKLFFYSLLTEMSRC